LQAMMSRPERLTRLPNDLDQVKAFVRKNARQA